MRIMRLLVAGLMLLGGRADAATAIGSCLTNVVCATMWEGPISAIAYEVSYCSSAMVCVVPPPRFELQKFASIDGTNWHKSTVAGAGTTVTFAICIFNGASVAVDGITIMDMLPDNTEIAVDVPTTWTGGNYHTNAVAPTLTLAWDTDDFGSAMQPPPLSDGQGTPVYMRWTISTLEALKSACVTFAAEIL